MILFVNVKLTPDIPWKEYDRGFLDRPTKVDIFKYTVASLAVIPFERVIMYVELDDSFKERQAEVKEYVEQEFRNVPLSYYTTRNCTQAMWQQALQEIAHLPEGYPIWYAGNHDQPFIDYDLGMLTLCLDAFHKDPTELKGIMYSHWSEFIDEILTHPSRIEYPGVVSYHHHYTHSIQIVSKALLFNWWYTGSYGDTFLPRSDWWYSNPLTGGRPIINGPTFKCLIPQRELCRHFDGYEHIGISPKTVCPPLDIPEGFFSNNIDIVYSKTKVPGKTSVWPKRCVTYAGNGYGPDLIGLVDDIPLFWKSRISSIEDRLDIQNPITGRNKFYYDAMNNVPSHRGRSVPYELASYTRRGPE